MQATDQELLTRWTDRADSEAFSELVARHGRMVLGVCRRVVRDVQLADDVAQECFLRLAEECGEKPQNLGGWLHRIATNRAVSTLRRRRRMPATTANEPRHAETPERVLAWREIEEHVDAAIAELPEELRMAVVGHFLQGRSHRELAADLDVAARTIGYRIERGIERVRTALAKRGIQLGRDGLPAAILSLPKVTSLPAAWSASLGKLALVGPGASLAPSGGALAGTKALLCAAVGLLLLALGSVWLLGGPTPASPPTSRDTAASGDRSSVSPAAFTAAAAAETPTAPRDRREVPATGSTGTARIHGRVVDENGQPLAGVSVTLRGSTRDQQTRARWLLEHGTLDWSHPDPVTTDDEGRFTVRFTPLPPLAFTLRVKPDSLVHQHGRWQRIAPGQDIDLRTIQLTRGTTLSGRVTDPSGRPVPVSRILAKPSATDFLYPAQNSRTLRPTLAPRNSTWSEVAADGTFTMKEPVPFGTALRFEVDGHRVLRPSEVAPVTGEQMRIDVVVAEDAGGDPARTIRGVVTAPDGSPIRRARILGRELEPFAFEAQLDPLATTDSDGAFVVTLPDGQSPDRPLTALHVHAAGYAPWSQTDPIPWGARPLQIALRAGPSLRIVATRQDTGAPIERFGVRLAPVRSKPGYSSADDDIQHSGSHAGGVLEVPSVTPFRYLVSVEPAESLGLAPMRPVEVDVTDGAPRVVQIALPVWAERVFEVRDADGNPAAGMRVELLRHRLGGRVALDMHVMPPEHARYNHAEHVAELHDLAVTDAAGRITLRAAGDTRYTLRFPGPTHEPFLVHDIDLNEPAMLEIELQPSGSVTGQVAPLTILATLREEAGHGTQGARRGVGVRLVATDGSGRIHPSAESAPFGAPIDDSGRFSISGVPHGSWDAAVTWTPSHALGWSARQRVVQHGIVVENSDTTAVALDLSTLATHETQLRVVVDGVARSARIDLVEVAGGADERRTLTTDSNGRVAARLPAGSWHSTVGVSHGGQMVELEGPVVVSGPGPVGTIELPVRLGSRVVRVERPDGAPAVGVQFDGVSGSATDEAGRTTLFGNAGPVSIYAAREPLQATHGGRLRVFRQLTGDVPPIYIEVGELTLHARTSEELVVRLPEAWLRMPD